MITATWCIDGPNVALDQAWDKGFCRLTWMWTDGSQWVCVFSPDELLAARQHIRRRKAFALGNRQLHPVENGWLLVSPTESKTIDSATLSRILERSPLAKDRAPRLLTKRWSKVKIQRALKTAQTSPIKLAHELGVRASTVRDVITGKTRSSRIENALADAIGADVINVFGRRLRR